MSIETVKSYDERLKAGVKGEEDERAEEATDALKDVGGGVSVSSEGAAVLAGDEFTQAEMNASVQRVAPEWKAEVFPHTGTSTDVDVDDEVRDTENVHWRVEGVAYADWFKGQREYERRAKAAKAAENLPKVVEAINNGSLSIDDDDVQRAVVREWFRTLHLNPDGVGNDEVVYHAFGTNNRKEAAQKIVAIYTDRKRARDLQSEEWEEARREMEDGDRDDANALVNKYWRGNDEKKWSEEWTKETFERTRKLALNRADKGYLYYADNPKVALAAFKGAALMKEGVDAEDLGEYAFMRELTGNERAKALWMMGELRNEEKHWLYSLGGNFVEFAFKQPARGFKYMFIGDSTATTIGQLADKYGDLEEAIKTGKMSGRDAALLAGALDISFVKVGGGGTNEVGTSDFVFKRERGKRKKEKTRAERLPGGGFDALARNRQRGYWELDYNPDAFLAAVKDTGALEEQDEARSDWVESKWAYDAEQAGLGSKVGKEGFFAGLGAGIGQIVASLASFGITAATFGRGRVIGNVITASARIGAKISANAARAAANAGMFAHSAFMKFDQEYEELVYGKGVPADDAFRMAGLYGTAAGAIEFGALKGLSNITGASRAVGKAVQVGAKKIGASQVARNAELYVQANQNTGIVYAVNLLSSNQAVRLLSREVGAFGAMMAGESLEEGAQAAVQQVIRNTYDYYQENNIAYFDDDSAFEAIADNVAEMWTPNGLAQMLPMYLLGIGGRVSSRGKSGSGTVDPNAMNSGGGAGVPAPSGNAPSGGGTIVPIITAANVAEDAKAYMEAMEARRKAGVSNEASMAFSLELKPEDKTRLQTRYQLTGEQMLLLENEALAKKRAEQTANAATEAENEARDRAEAEQEEAPTEAEIEGALANIEGEPAPAPEAEAKPVGDGVPVATEGATEAKPASANAETEANTEAETDETPATAMAGAVFIGNDLHVVVSHNGSTRGFKVTDARNKSKDEVISYIKGRVSAIYTPEIEDVIVNALDNGQGATQATEGGKAEPLPPVENGGKPSIEAVEKLPEGVKWDNGVTFAQKGTNKKKGFRSRTVFHGRDMYIGFRVGKEREKIFVVKNAFGLTPKEALAQIALAYGGKLPKSVKNATTTAINNAHAEANANGTTETEAGTDNTSAPEASRFDTPADARKRGYREVEGTRYDRQENIGGEYGREAGVNFGGESGRVSARYKLIEAEEAQPSHLANGQPNDRFFLGDAQPKDRRGATSQDQYDKIAKDIHPEEITGEGGAFTGAPIVNERGEVIQGNGRIASLKVMYFGNAFGATFPESAAKYKEYLKANAEHFGLTAEQVEKMKNPILVREVAVNDAEAVRLGNMKAQDTEAGGKQNIDAQQVAALMQTEELKEYAEILTDGTNDEESFGSMVRRNARSLLQMLLDNKRISPDQFNSAFNAQGNPTPEAVAALKNILAERFLADAPQRCRDIWNGEDFPDKAKKAIAETFWRDLNSDKKDSILQDLYGAILILGDTYLAKYDQGGLYSKLKKTASLDEAKKVIMKYLFSQTDMLQKQTLAEKYSAAAFYWAAAFEAQGQRALAANLNNVFTSIQEGVADMFLGKKPAQTKIQTYNDMGIPVQEGDKNANETYAREHKLFKYDVPQKNTNLTPQKKRLRTTLIKNMAKALGCTVKTFSGRTLDALDVAKKGSRLSFIGQGGAMKLGGDVRQNLQVAEAMEQGGLFDAKTIWLATGWERGNDGRWRYEVPPMTIKKGVKLTLTGKTKYTAKLGDIVDAPEMFKAYPKLKDLTVVFDVLPKGTNGGISPKTLDIEINWMRYNNDGSQAGWTVKNRELTDKAIVSLTHEVQHAIQFMEGLSIGGNATLARDFYYNHKVRVATEEFKKKYEELNKKQAAATSAEERKAIAHEKIILARAHRDELKKIESDAKKLNSSQKFEVYKKLTGEVEARNAQTRLGLTEEERKNTPPSETEDVARDEQYVREEGDQTGKIYERRYSRELKNPDGTVFGWYDPVKREIHLNEDMVDFDTPVHEFTHAWSDIVEQEDKRLADHIVSLVQNTKEYAAFVKEMNESEDSPYRGLSERQIAWEVFSRLTGKKGEEIAMQEGLTMFSRLREAIKKFYGKLLATFGLTDEQIAGLTLDECVGMTLRDLTDSKSMGEKAAFARMNAANKNAPNQKKFVNDEVDRLAGENEISDSEWKKKVRAASIAVAAALVKRGKVSADEVDYELVQKALPYESSDVLYAVMKLAQTYAHVVLAAQLQYKDNASLFKAIGQAREALFAQKLQEGILKNAQISPDMLADAQVWLAKFNTLRKTGRNSRLDGYKVGELEGLLKKSIIGEMLNKFAKTVLTEDIVSAVSANAPAWAQPSDILNATRATLYSAFRFAARTMVYSASRERALALVNAIYDADSMEAVLKAANKAELFIRAKGIEMKGDKLMDAIGKTLDSSVKKTGEKMAPQYQRKFSADFITTLKTARDIFKRLYKATKTKDVVASEQILMEIAEEILDLRTQATRTDLNNEQLEQIIAKLAAYNWFKGFDPQNLSRLEEIYSTIAKEIEGDFETKKAQRKAFKQAAEADAMKLNEAIKANPAKNVNIDGGGKVEKLKGLALFHQNFEQMFEHIVRFAKGESGKWAKAWVRNLNKQEALARNDKAKAVKARMNAVDNALEAMGIPKKKQKEFAKKIETPREDLARFSRTGSKLTIDQVLNLYLALRQDDIGGRLLRMTGEDRNRLFNLQGDAGENARQLWEQVQKLPEMEKFLRDGEANGTGVDLVKVGDLLCQNFKENAARFNAACKEFFGVDGMVSESDDYFPVVRDRQKGMVITSNMVGSSIIPSAAFARIPNNNPISEVQGAFGLFLDTMDKVEHFNAYHKLSQYFSVLFNNGTMSRTMNDKLGSKYKTALVRAVSDVVNGRFSAEDGGWVSDVFNFVVNATSMLMIGFNPSAMLMQGSGTSNWLYRHTLSEVGKSAWLWTNPVEQWRNLEEIRKHVLMSERYSPAQKEAMEVFTKKPKLRRKAFNRWAMAMLKGGDFVASVVLGVGIYAQMKEQLLREINPKTGKVYTYEEAADAAGALWFDEVEKLQQASNTANLTSAQRRGGAYMRPFLQFKSAVIQMWGNEVQAALAFAANRNWDNAKRLGRAMFVNHVYAATWAWVIENILQTIFGDDDDEDLWSIKELLGYMLLGQFSGVPILGDFAANIAMGEYTRATQSPVFSGGDRIIRGTAKLISNINKAAEGEDDFDVEDNLKLVVKTAGGSAGNYAVKIVNKIEDDE